MGQDLAVESAPISSAAAGPHAERLSSLVTAQRASVDRETGLELYRDMTLGRRFEDKCAEMYYRGKMFGFVHLYNGQEAVSTGVIGAMKRQHDWFCSTYRDHVHALSAGVPARQVMSELFGKETGCSKGRGGSMHLFSKEHHLLGGFAFIAEGIPVALGSAFTSRYRRDALGDSSSNAVTAAFFGDGTCNNGQFFECLNMAQLWKLPIIFVVENNKWAIGMAHDRATSDPEIWRKAGSFGMAGEEVDGMDVLAVRAAAQRAIERARAGEGQRCSSASPTDSGAIPWLTPTSCVLNRRNSSGPSAIPSKRWNVTSAEQDWSRAMNCERSRKRSMPSSWTVWTSLCRLRSQIPRN